MSIPNFQLLDYNARSFTTVINSALDNASDYKVGEKDESTAEKRIKGAVEKIEFWQKEGHLTNVSLDILDNLKYLKRTIALAREGKSQESTVAAQADSIRRIFDELKPNLPKPNVEAAKRAYDQKFFQIREKIEKQLTGFTNGLNKLISTPNPDQSLIDSTYDFLSKASALCLRHHSELNEIGEILRDIVFELKFIRDENFYFEGKRQFHNSNLISLHLDKINRLTNMLKRAEPPSLKKENPISDINSKIIAELHQHKMPYSDQNFISVIQGLKKAIASSLNPDKTVKKEAENALEEAFKNSYEILTWWYSNSEIGKNEYNLLLVYSKLNDKKYPEVSQLDIILAEKDTYSPAKLKNILTNLIQNVTSEGLEKYREQYVNDKPFDFLDTKEGLIIRLAEASIMEWRDKGNVKNLTGLMDYLPYLDIRRWGFDKASAQDSLSYIRKFILGMYSPENFNSMLQDLEKQIKSELANGVAFDKETESEKTIDKVIAKVQEWVKNGDIPPEVGVIVEDELKPFKMVVSVYRNDPGKVDVDGQFRLIRDRLQKVQK